MRPQLHLTLPALDRDVPAPRDDPARALGVDADHRMQRAVQQWHEREATWRELREPRGRDVVAPDAPDDAVERSELGRAGVAVAREHRDVRVAERVEPRRRAGRDFLVDVDRHDPTGRPDEFREHRREVPGTGTDLEHRHPGREREQIGLDREELRRRRGAGRAARRARDAVHRERAVGIVQHPQRRDVAFPVLDRLGPHPTDDGGQRPPVRHQPMTGHAGEGAERRVADACTP